MLLLMLACLTTEDEYEALMDRAMDSDGDGHIAAEHGGDDCDDDDALVAPGLEETCDEKDNDCDSDVDEDASDAGTFYRDWDLDGFGDESEALESCFLPKDYADVAGDCDDRDALINPSAAEVCDGGIDNDCDGLTDDADEVDLSSGGTYYLDNDGDGFGDDAEALQACEPPDGYVDRGGDCDDQIKKVNPWRAEVCGDGLDNDCSGGAPECGFDGEYRLSSADMIHWGAYEGDRYGNSVVGLPSATGGEPDTLLIGAPGEDLQAVEAGWLGLLSDPLTDDSTKWREFFREGDGEAGGVTTLLGDLNADGWPDVWTATSPERGQGTSGYLLLGSSDGFASSRKITSNWPAFGLSAVGLMSAKGGAPALAVGSPAYLWGTGAVHLWTDTLPQDGDTDLDASIRLIGEKEGDALGVFASMCTGDFNADGNSDLLMASFSSDKAYFIENSSFLDGDFGVADVGAVFEWTEGATAKGGSVAQGDFNGDGYADIALGMINRSTSLWEDAGAVFIFQGSASTWGLRVTEADATSVITGDTSQQSLGFAMTAGEASGDLSDDLFIAGTDTDRAGTIFYFTDIPEGNSEVSTASATFDAIRKADCGWAMTVADLNNDGMGDLTVGCPKSETDTFADETGSVHIFLTQGL